LAIKIFPISVEPVNDSFFRTMDSKSVSPPFPSPSPSAREYALSERPHASASSAAQERRKASVKRASRTTVQPAPMAGARFARDQAKGKFHGVMQANDSDGLFDDYNPFIR